MKGEINGFYPYLLYIQQRNEYPLTKTESIRSNFNFQWTKTLYQNNYNSNNIAFFFTFFQGLITCNNTRDYLSWRARVKKCQISQEF